MFIVIYKSVYIDNFRFWSFVLAPLDVIIDVIVMGVAEDPAAPNSLVVGVVPLCGKGKTYGNSCDTDNSLSDEFVAGNCPPPFSILIGGRGLREEAIRDELC